MKEYIESAFNKRNKTRRNAVMVLIGIAIIFLGIMFYANYAMLMSGKGILIIGIIIGVIALLNYVGGSKFKKLETNIWTVYNGLTEEEKQILDEQIQQNKEKSIIITDKVLAAINIANFIIVPYRKVTKITFTSEKAVVVYIECGDIKQRLEFWSENEVGVVYLALLKYCSSVPIEVKGMRKDYLPGIVARVCATIKDE